MLFRQVPACKGSGHWRDRDAGECERRTGDHCRSHGRQQGESIEFIQDAEELDFGTKVKLTTMQSFLGSIFSVQEDFIKIPFCLF